MWRRIYYDVGEGCRFKQSKKNPMVAFGGRMVLTYDLPEPWRLFRTCSRSEEETEMSNPVNVRLVFVRFEGRNLVRCYGECSATKRDTLRLRALFRNVAP